MKSIVEKGRGHESLGDQPKHRGPMGALCCWWWSAFDGQGVGVVEFILPWSKQSCTAIPVVSADMPKLDDRCGGVGHVDGRAPFSEYSSEYCRMRMEKSWVKMEQLNKKYIYRG